MGDRFAFLFGLAQKLLRVLSINRLSDQREIMEQVVFQQKLGIWGEKPHVFQERSQFVKFWQEDDTLQSDNLRRQ